MRIKRQYLKIAGWILLIFGLTSWFAGLILFLLFNLPLTSCFPWTIWQYYAIYGNSKDTFYRLIVTVCTFGPWFITGYFVLDRVLHYKKRKLHGNAKFATTDEIEEAGLFPKSDKLDKTILLGKYKGKYLCYGGYQFVLLAAPTRSGKGVGVVIPNCLNYSDSLVVLDIKLENYRITSGFRKACGQDVYLFAPYDTQGRTCRYNPLSYISKDKAFQISDIDSISAALFSTKVGSDEFWSDQAKDMFRGLCLFVLEQPELPHTLGEMFRQASGKGKPLKDHLQQTVEAKQKEGKPFSSACIDCLNRVITMPDNTFGSVVATFNSKMKMFQNVLVDMATSDNDFDLRDVRKKKMTIYFGITPNKLADAAGLVNLFFDQLINLNVNELPEDNPKELKYQCLMIMDEFTSIGKVEIINKSVSFQAGYNMRLLTIIQNKSQLEQCYGKDGAVTLLSNHAVQIIYQPSTATPNDAKEYSDMIGYETVRNGSKSISYNSTSESFSDQKRALILPQELRELGDKKEIVCTDKCRPFKCEKIKYYLDPEFVRRGWGKELGLKGVYPPASTPKYDLNEFIAKIEKRTRFATEEDFTDNKEPSLVGQEEFPETDPNLSEEMMDMFVEEQISYIYSKVITETDSGVENRKQAANEAVEEVFDDLFGDLEDAPEEKTGMEKENAEIKDKFSSEQNQQQTQQETLSAEKTDEAIEKLSGLDLSSINLNNIFGGETA